MCKSPVGNPQVNQRLPSWPRLSQSILHITARCIYRILCSWSSRYYRWVPALTLSFNVHRTNHSPPPSTPLHKSFTSMKSVYPPHRSPPNQLRPRQDGLFFTLLLYPISAHTWSRKPILGVYLPTPTDDVSQGTSLLNLKPTDFTFKNLNLLRGKSHGLVLIAASSPK